MPSKPKSDRSLIGRIGGLTLHSRIDSTAHLAPARKAFREKFDREVDPNNELPEPERHRRAELARRAFYARIARERTRKQRAKKAAKPTGGA